MALTCPLAAVFSDGHGATLRHVVHPRDLELKTVPATLPLVGAALVRSKAQEGQGKAPEGHAKAPEGQAKEAAGTPAPAAAGPLPVCPKPLRRAFGVSR